MKKIVAAVLGVLMSVFIIVGPAATPASAYSCTWHWTSDYRTVKVQDGFSTYKFRLMTEMNYRHCWKRARHWVDPAMMYVGCRRLQEGGAVLREVKYNPYIWDKDGHSINPGIKYGDCNTQSYTRKEYQFPAMQRLHMCGAGSPRWRTTARLNLVLQKDKTVTMSSTFWGFTGPVLIKC